MTQIPLVQHPILDRRLLLQAGGIGLLGLGMEHIPLVRGQADPAKAHIQPPARSAIYIFLSGGLAQHDSFDPKPDAPETIRGEFSTIATTVPGVRICEHLPLLAARFNKWSMVRSLTHSTNNHSDGHLLMLTGRNQLPSGFNPSSPKDSDWPSIASIISALAPVSNNLPPAVVLPEKLVHFSGRVIPGQFGGLMGRHHDPWFLEASRYEPKAYGAYPTYEFDHQNRPYQPQRMAFAIPDLSLPQGLDFDRLSARLDILKSIDQQRAQLSIKANFQQLQNHRGTAVSLLTDAKVRHAFDLKNVPVRDIERFGNNSFGWSLLIACRLIEAGVTLVQVNLGNNETWDTHGNAFPHLKEKLLPPTDRAVSALLDDLEQRGLLDSTLIIMGGEFGRTPRISTLPQFYQGPGRDHWGSVQTIFCAGGGSRGGKVIGASDKIGAFPKDDPATPENLAATIYQALGLPATTAWRDAENRPHYIFQGEPIRGLLST